MSSTTVPAGNHSERRGKGKGVENSCHPGSGGSGLPSPDAFFREVDDLLTGEEHCRYERELEVSRTYQGKTALFLAFTGFFSALVGAALRDVLKPWQGAGLQITAVITLCACLSLLLVTVFLLTRSALSEGHGDLAVPRKWREYAQELWAVAERFPYPNQVALTELQRELRQARARATDTYITRNDRKARQLRAASRLLQAAGILAGLGMFLYVAHVISTATTM